jgi:2'-5' RNA ligase
MAMAVASFFKMTYPRQQLSLFVPSGDAAIIERVRRLYNPLQQAIIPGHITLCREDELRPLDRVLANLAQLVQGPITVDMGQPLRFNEGKGLLLPGVGTNDAFAALRKRVLHGVDEHPRPHHPHLTLIHPRNGTCTDPIFAAIRHHQWPKQLVFPTISLIEQTEEAAVWQVLREYPLSQ